MTIMRSGSAFASLIGGSPAFVRALDLMKQIAATEAPVLIEGETGTGKEVAARALHYGGPRRDRPFVPVNCGALPETLIENELFGHARGAFTDARDAREGLVAIADGGTLFLDEVDTLSPKAQVAVLRFLQDQTFRPLGAKREERSDVRVIAATNVRLSDLVDARTFRVDLYYRLQILLLRLPPLRERPGDPMVLAEHFGRVLATRYRLAPRAIDPASALWLDRHGWPGNVRELENFMHREVLLGGDAPLCASPARLGLPPLTPEESRAATEGAAAFREAKARAIAEFERRFLTSALAASHGNVSLAARRCGKERRAFGKLLQRYGITRDAFVPGA